MDIQTGKPFFTVTEEMYSAKLKADFGRLDEDGSEFVTPEELRVKAKEVYYYSLSEKELLTVIDTMDLDGDGKISLDEFVAAAVSK